MTLNTGKYRPKISIDKAFKVLELYKNKIPTRKIAEQIDISQNTVMRVINGVLFVDNKEFQNEIAEIRSYLSAEPTEIACSKCRRVFPRTAEFFNLLKSRESKKGLRKEWSCHYEAICRECKALASRDLRRKIKYECLSVYSNGIPCCKCCGETFIEFLSIDHIGGGGAAHRKEYKGKVSTIHLHLKQCGYPHGYQVLCMNCNTSLGFHGYCPHQRQTGCELSCDDS